MDHILFLLAEQWERLQVHLSSLLTNTQRYSIEAGAAIHRESSRAWRVISQPGTWESIQAVIIRWIETVRRTQLRDLLAIIDYPVTRAHVLIGSAGLALGGSLGFLLGVNWRTKLPYGPKIRAVAISRYDGIPGVGMIEDLSMPRITSSDEVLVNVRAASVDPADLKIPYGYGHVLRSHYSRYYKDSSLFPVILGRDCVGVVVETGRGVTHVDVGDRVWAVVPYWSPGLMCEYIVIKESKVAKVPPQLCFEVAATVPYSAIMLWHSLAQVNLNSLNTRNKRVLILSSECGTGLLAVQVIKAWGGHVTTTCSPPNIPFLQRLGADDIIQYGQHTNFNKELDMREKFDVIFNNVGVGLKEACLFHCLEGGKVVDTLDVDVPSDSYNFAIRYLYFLWLRIKSLISKRLVFEELSVDVLEEITRMIRRGDVHPVVGRCFPSWDADLAFQHSAAGHLLGKTVLSFSVRKELAEMLPKH